MKKPLIYLRSSLLVFFLCLLIPIFLYASEPKTSSTISDAELAQELSNPVADLITLPIQMNYDQNYGSTDDGWKFQTNIQPVLPLSLNEEWNIITRTILPVVSQEDIFLGAGSQFGLGDTSFSMFFSPKEPTSGGVIWGVGPIFLLPTATQEELGTEKWGAGPSAIALTMKGPWTLGVLSNHIWSFAGESQRDEVNNTFMQPFVAYTWSNAWTVSFQSETTYNWESGNWSVPINFAVAKLVRIGKLPVSLQAGFGYWAESPDAGPEGLRFRLQANFVLPKPK
ncbi:MAG: hypothetical protein ACI8PB_003762 [Desulforhopalus sp.]|jgi:hypothetical protein